MANVVNDISAYQRFNLNYFRELKGLGSRGIIVKMTEGTDYLNQLAKYQVYNAFKVFGSVSAYHFLDGNESALSQARFFSNWLKAFHLDSSTVWALDVEAYNLPWNCDHMIDQFINYMKAHGYPKGKVVYGSASWFNEGRINRNVVDTNKFWIAAYDASEPGVDDTSVWQYSDNFKGLNTDASLDFNNTFVPISKPKRHPKSNHKIAHKSTNQYWHKTGTYKVTSSVNVYRDLSFKHNDDVHLEKGSTFKVTGVVSSGIVTRLKTNVGFISGNSKYVRPIK